MLDVDGCTTVYREPVSLNQLAVPKRRASEFGALHGTRYRPLLQLSLRMSFIPWGMNKPVIAKLTDSSNNIAQGILAKKPDARAVLLYSGMFDFLAANLKSPGRGKFPGLLAGRAGTDAGCLGFQQQVDTNRLTDAERAILCG